MKTLEIIGYKRANLGKSESKKLREEGNVPCVIYGGEEQVHFYAPMILFRPLVYSPEIYFVELNIEDKIYNCILQDIQFHPVSEMILHVDFMELHDDKPIKMQVPVKFFGDSPGIRAGGKLMINTRTLLVRALPKDMPESIDLDISEITLGMTIKVKEVKTDNFEIQNNPQVSIASVSIPRAAKLGDEEELEEEELEEGEEGAEEGGEAAPKGEGEEKSTE
ncbi:MAG: 50S ribosomal protein L25/general stress protein Ctc [Cyclobacteriaceae bacterium]|jgi:large subunit ribosomal protein L25